MPTRVRSFSKINLGLAIGPLQPDGFHGLTTMYQTIGLCDLLTVSARAADATKITLKTNSPFVPVDSRNTVWKMVERCLQRMDIAAEVFVSIDKRLPVQGGIGAGSANAAAALVGLERELGLALDGVARLEMAAGVGSDVPLFLLGGSVLGLGHGEQVVPLPDIPTMPCVVAIPRVRVSTPQAFRDWDARLEPKLPAPPLTSAPIRDKLGMLSWAYSSMSARTGVMLGNSDIFSDALSLEKQQLGSDFDQKRTRYNIAENALIALVSTGIENDFEEVVFPQYPALRETKRLLMGSDSGGPALYAALSGSGSALFGLYRSKENAEAAQHRVQASGVEALVTVTLPRANYWRTLFAE